MLVLGGSLLEKVFGKVILDADVKYIGPAKFDCDYLKVGKELSRNMVTSPLLNYTPAPRYTATKATVLAEIYEPFFSRTYGKFCSPQNTANQEKPARHSGAFRHGNIIFLPHALGAIYQPHGARLHRDLFLNALGLLYKKPVVEIRLPSEGRINLWHQPQNRRYVLHLLYASPIQRGRCSIIEDIVTLHDIKVSLRVPQKIKRVKVPLEKAALPVKNSRGQATVTVPSLTMHQVVVFEY